MDLQPAEARTLKFGRRTYFFDTREATNGTKYLKITESSFVKDSDERKRNSFILFKDDLDEFIKVLKKTKNEIDDGVKAS